MEFIPKEKNPPSVPQARGIEMIWANYKRAYCLRKELPRNLNGFKRVMAKISKEVAGKMGKSCMKHAKRMLRDIGYKGVRKAMNDISKKKGV